MAGVQIDGVGSILEVMHCSLVNGKDEEGNGAIGMHVLVDLFCCCSISSIEVLTFSFTFNPSISKWVGTDGDVASVGEV